MEGGVFASGPPEVAGRMQKDIGAVHPKPLASLGKSGSIDLSSRPVRRDESPVRHEGTGIEPLSPIKGPGRQVDEVMMRRQRIGVAALGGLLVFLTGCEAVVNGLKANYAVKQGNDLYKAQGYLKSVEWYRYATYLRPELAIAYKNAAFAYMGEYKPGSKHPKDLRYAQGAIDNLKRYLDRVPGERDSENYLLTMYLQTERYDEAAAYFQEALKNGNRDPAETSEMMLRIGMIYAKKGDFESSLEWYKKRAEIEKDNPEALYTIGVLCWDKVFHAPLTIDLDRRKQLIDMGLDYLTRAMTLRDNYFEAVAYVNLLNREKAKVAQQIGNMDDYAKYMQEADKYQKMAMEMRKKQMAKQ